VSIDTKDLKIGDHVLVHSIITATTVHGQWYSRPVDGEPGDGTAAWTPTSAIREILPRPLEVGDRVIFRTNPKHSVRGDIKSVITPYAWVEWNSGIETYHEVVALSALERAQ